MQHAGTLRFIWTLEVCTDVARACIVCYFTAAWCHQTPCLVLTQCHRTHANTNVAGWYSVNSKIEIIQGGHIRHWLSFHSWLCEFSAIILKRILSLWYDMLCYCYAIGMICCAMSLICYVILDYAMLLILLCHAMILLCYACYVISRR